MRHTVIRAFIVLCLCLIHSSPALAGDVARPRTIEEFFKENSNLRISQASVQDYQATLNTLTRQVLTRAEELVLEDERKTIKKRDIAQASSDVLRRSPVEVPELMEKVTQLSIIELVELTKQVNTYSESLLENP